MKSLVFLTAIVVMVLIYFAIKNAAASAASSLAGASQSLNQNLSSFFTKWNSGANISSGDAGGLDVMPINPSYPPSPDLQGQ
jgi:hypothetical protein